MIEATDALQSPRVFVPLVHCGDQVGPSLAQTVVNVGAMRGQASPASILAGLISLKRPIGIDCPGEVSMLLRAARTDIIRAPASFPHVRFVAGHQGQVKRLSSSSLRIRPVLLIVDVGVLLLENQPERPPQQEGEIELEAAHDLREELIVPLGASQLGLLDLLVGCQVAQDDRADLGKDHGFARAHEIRLGDFHSNLTCVNACIANDLAEVLKGQSGGQ